MSAMSLRLVIKDEYHNTPKMQQKDIRFLGKKVTYYLYGKGENTLILLHGFLENSSMWNDYINRWENEYRIIAIDLAGHGKTESLAEVNSPQLISDAVDTVMKNENIQSAVFLGHSMGGYVALSYGERYLEKVKGVLLLNSSALADSEIKKADRDRAIKVLKKNPSIFINEAIPNLFADENREKFKEDLQKIISIALATDIDGACACLRGMKIRDDKTHLLKANKFPVKFIAGAKDNVMPLDKTREQIALHPEIQSEIFYDSGHLSFIEAKEECFVSTQKFIDWIFKN
jgi:pimeloyl-ACP methyl ester carboxylesterase